MKKLFLATVIAALTVTSSFAQGEVRFGIKGGLNLASIGGDAYYAGFGGFNSRTSFHIGALVEIPFTDKISLQPEVLYSSQGSKTNYGFGTSADTKLDYISIPIMGKYHIIAGLSGELGPVINILASADGLNSTTLIVGDVKNQYKSLDVGIGIGASYQLPIGLFGSLRYNKGVTDINDDKNVTVKNQNNVFQVSAGYTF
jgi:hypothetical protein